MEHLFSAWPRVAMRLRDARAILLLSDYDGTLTLIVERPELANLPTDTRRLLEALARQWGIRVGIISGRALGNLKNKVGIPGIIYSGNHGLEVEGPGIAFVNPVAEQVRPLLRVVHLVLDRTLSTVKGVFVEDKGLSLSVHHRLADKRRAADVERTVNQVVGASSVAGQTRLSSGKHVWEVRPAVNWNKGRAIRLLMKRYGKGGRRSGLVPIYLGDDKTDEDGFKAVENYGDGLSVFIGEPNVRTLARHFLK
jgi:trehalose 6-phosphate phosphatase